ncbi:Uncharacterized protein APZ42_007170, partial [Daphnia magna]
TQTANTLKTEIARHGGEQSKVDDLLQQVKFIHGKEKEFLSGTITVLQKEVLIQQISEKKLLSELKLENSNLNKQFDNIKKKAKSSKYTLSSSLEQLQENNNTLTKSLEKAHTRIKELENNQESTTAQTYLKSLLKKQEDVIADIEKESQETINQLEKEKKLLIEKLDATKKEVKNTSERIQQLETEIRETKKAFNETQTEKKSLRKNLTDITVKTRDIEKELLEAQAYTTKQQDKISYLESRI